MTKRGGFTLVELVVVVVAIGILTGLAVIGVTRYQADTRDAKRSANISTLSNALETYFTENGNYPSCEAISKDAKTVTTNTLKGLDKAALLVPGAPADETNSIRCGETLALAGEDFIEYRGDGSTACKTTGSCSTYTLLYRNEIDSTIDELSGRRMFANDTPVVTPTANTPTAQDPQKLGTPALSATVNSPTQITTNWTPAANATKDTTYTLVRAIDSAFSIGVVRTAGLKTTSSVSSGLAAGRSYFFRVQAVSPNETSEFSNTASNVVTPDVPSGVSATVNSASQITVSWKASANATGYKVSYGLREGAATYVATTNRTSLPLSANITQGTQWFFSVTAVSNSLESAPSASVEATTPIDAPAPFDITSMNDSASLTGVALEATCPEGTTKYFSWKANDMAWVQGTNYTRATYPLSNGQSITLKAAVRCQKGSAKSAYTVSRNSVSYGRAGMNLTLSPGADDCVAEYCGRTITANWNNICRTGAPTIKAKQLSSLASWKATSATSDTIKWKGASDPGVRVSYYDVNIGCASATSTINVISAYKCTGCK
jgi:prepilin-type N-terminal cleavage/methylation domain-containing protein